MLAEIHRDGEVLEQRMEGERLLVEARVDEALAGRLRRAGAEVTQRKSGAAPERRGLCANGHARTRTVDLCCVKAAL